jgi:hypothetical protein
MGLPSLGGRSPLLLLLSISIAYLGIGVVNDPSISQARCDNVANGLLQCGEAEKLRINDQHLPVANGMRN